MRVFVTNLPSSSERNKHITEQLDGLGVDYEFAECVIGKDLTDEVLEQECDLDALRMANADTEWLNRGMIGCTMTSRNIHKEIVQRNLDCAMLLEDDAVLPENFLKILNDCEAMISPGDVVLLYWVGWETILLKKETEIALGSVRLFEPLNPERIGGGTATIFSRSAAEGMLEVNTPIRTAPDCWNFFKEEGAFNRILCAYPLPISTADFMSTMELGRFVWARKIINSYRIFPIYHLLKYKRRRFRKLRVKARIV